MKIKVGKYIINSDKYCYWIEEEYTVGKGKTKGKTAIRNITGYCSTFDRCLQSFRERTIGASEAETIEELLSAVRDVYGAMDALNRAAMEQGLDKIESIAK